VSRDVAGEAGMAPYHIASSVIWSITISERSMAIDHHHTPYLLNLTESVRDIRPIGTKVTKAYAYLLGVFRTGALGPSSGFLTLNSG
jgi:hypothetical protein